jgi:single-strand DNA-binding protein
MNSVSVIGNIGQDTEIRYTSGGKPVANVSLALDQGKDAQGQKKAALWIKVVLWDKQAESLTQYLTKGTKIGVVGELTFPEAWANKQDGKPNARVVITARRITLLGGPRNDAPAGNEPAEDTRGHAPEVADEDIPF